MRMVAMGVHDVMRQRFGIACVAAFAALYFAVPAVAAGPEETMRETVDQVLAILKDPSLDDDQRRAAIEKVAYVRFDMYTTSKLVLGDPWKKLSPQQRKAYITEFKQYLANRYGGHIGGYDQETVDFLTVRKEPRGQATVRTRIVGGKFEGTRVDYRMREKDGQWFMIDVTIENSSMISILKDECKEMLRRGGPDHLIQKLREKNALGPVED